MLPTACLQTHLAFRQNERTITIKNDIILCYQSAACDRQVEPAEAGEEEDPMIGPLSWRIPLRISRGPPPQTTPHPPSHPKPPVSLLTQRQSQPSPLQQALQDAASSQQRSSRVAGEGVSSAAARKGQQERLFWPEAVGTNWIVRSAAETACVEEWTAKHGSAADDKALLKEALT